MKKKAGKKNKNAKKVANKSTQVSAPSSKGIWIVGSVAVVALIAITISMLFFFGDSDDNNAVAFVNGRQLNSISVQNELRVAEHNLAEAYFDMFPDDWDIDHEREFRGGLSFGHAVREEAVRLAAVTALIEEYTQQIGVYLTDDDIQWIEDDIDDFVAQFGQEELDDYLLRNNFRDRAHLSSVLNSQQLMMNLIDEIMFNPVEFARFEPYMPVHDTAEAEARAHELLARAHGGEDFDMLIALYGEDPGMEWNPDGYTFTIGQMVVEFEQATQELEIGEISGLVRTQFGYHIIKRVEPNPHEMWNEDAEWLGAKHILISMETPSIEENIWNAINLMFGAMLDGAEIELLPALDDISVGR